MIRSARTILWTVSVLGTSLANVADLQACDARRSFYRSRPSYFQPPTSTQPSRIVRSQPHPIMQPQSQFRPIQHSFAPQQPALFPAQPTPPPQQPAPTGGQPDVQSGVQRGVEPTVPSTSPANNAQMTALQALAGLASSQAPAETPATPAPTRVQTSAQAPAQNQAQTPDHVGSWTANLANGARVQLQLQADGAFSWSATNRSGTTSTFQGTYAAGNGSLTLIRSSDNQKLAGAMTSTGPNSFNFKLSGTKDSGLNFSSPADELGCPPTETPHYRHQIQRRTCTPACSAFCLGGLLRHGRLVDLSSSNRSAKPGIV